MIWGWVVNEEMEDRVEVTVIATGFEEELLGNRAVRPQKKKPAPRAGARPFSERKNAFSRNFSASNIWDAEIMGSIHLRKK